MKPKEICARLKSDGGERGGTWLDRWFVLQQSEGLVHNHLLLLNRIRTEYAWKKLIVIGNHHHNVHQHLVAQWYRWNCAIWCAVMGQSSLKLYKSLSLCLARKRNDVIIYNPLLCNITKFDGAILLIGSDPQWYLLYRKGYTRSWLSSEIIIIGNHDRKSSEIIIIIGNHHDAHNRKSWWWWECYGIREVEELGEGRTVRVLKLLLILAYSTHSHNSIFPCWVELSISIHNNNAHHFVRQFVCILCGTAL